MTIWTPTVDASTTKASTIRKTRAVTLKYELTSLMPNSKYFFFVNGVDMTWACRQDGRRMGDGLISDAGGYIEVFFMAEINTSSTNDTVASATKYHTIVIKDISGRAVSFSITQQMLIGK